MEPVRPLLEVDRFQWPDECQQLCAWSRAALDRFVSRLMSDAAEGVRRVALAGVHEGVGCTTVALCLARRAAAQDANWTLLDADDERAAVAARLGIVGQEGWSRVVAGKRELGEVMIASLEDRLTIVPGADDALATPRTLKDARTSGIFDALAESCDLVLVDAGTAGAVSVDRLVALDRAAHFDALYLVYDARSVGEGEVAACARRLGEAGLRVTGGIENFTPRAADAAAE
jgi:tyrosine-protein kinase Etk/Wzc